MVEIGTAYGTVNMRSPQGSCSSLLEQHTSENIFLIALKGCQRGVLDISGDGPHGFLATGTSTTVLKSD